MVFHSGIMRLIRLHICHSFQWPNLYNPLLYFLLPTSTAATKQLLLYPTGARKPLGNTSEQVPASAVGLLTSVSVTLPAQLRASVRPSGPTQKFSSPLVELCFPSPVPLPPPEATPLSRGLTLGGRVLLSGSLAYLLLLVLGLASYWCGPNSSAPYSLGFIKFITCLWHSASVLCNYRIGP